MKAVTVAEAAEEGQIRVAVAVALSCAARRP